jgi:hypothetical protein
MSFICKNCKKHYINEKSYVKHEMNCEKRVNEYSNIDVENLLDRIVKLEREIKLLKNKGMDIIEWLEEYYSDHVQDFNQLSIDVTIRDLKHMFYNTMTQGIDRLMENHDLDCMRFVNHKMYYYVHGKWTLMPEKELQQMIQRIIKSINQTFDDYVISDNLLENEEGKYAIYTSKLYSSNLDKIIKKSIHQRCKVLYP